jgi:2-dehydro-3-deoxygalactonokinase
MTAIPPAPADQGPSDPGPLDASGIAPAWIAVDWGTTNLRAWAMSAADRPMTRAESDRGMARLSGPAAFEPALLALVGPWLGGRKVSVIACGMAGARQGWREAPYARTPCPPLAGDLVPAPVTTPGLSVLIVPGLAQDDPADVMRGEETQIAGYLRQTAGRDGFLCLPGTHTKWVHLAAGRIEGFRTVMTGELFATLSTQTVLRHSVTTQGWDDVAFTTALAEGMARPGALTARLFGLRADGLLHGAAPETARARLSGLLIGAELAATRPFWEERDVTIIGAGPLARLYQTALSTQDVRARLADATAVTLAGLTAARHRAGASA